MGILASEFYQDRRQRLRKVSSTASASRRRDLFAALTRSRDLAGKRLAARPADVDAHFALALASGIECNYAVFVEKRRYELLGLTRKYVEFLPSDSTDPKTVARISGRVRGKKVLLTFDSDRSMSHVLRELQLYSPMVSEGSYIVAEDTHHDYVPTYPSLERFRRQQSTNSW